MPFSSSIGREPVAVRRSRLSHALPGQIHSKIFHLATRCARAITRSGLPRAPVHVNDHVFAFRARPVRPSTGADRCGSLVVIRLAAAEPLVVRLGPQRTIEPWGRHLECRRAAQDRAVQGAAESSATSAHRSTVEDVLVSTLTMIVRRHPRLRRRPQAQPTTTRHRFGEARTSMIHAGRAIPVSYTHRIKNERATSPTRNVHQHKIPSSLTIESYRIIGPGILARLLQSRAGRGMMG